MKYDVVVVGGGPVGLLLACELRLAGVRTIVLDKLSEPAGHDRAGILHTRTVESLDVRGLLDRFTDGTGTSPGLPFAGIFSHGLEHRLLDTRHQFSLLIPQSRTEELLAARAAELETEIRRGHEVTGLRQDPDGVTVTVRSADGEYELRGAYVVGCDGGRSTVRRVAGIDFPGYDAEVSALIGYVTCTEKDVPRSWQRTPGGIVVLNFPPEGGIGRVVTVEYGRSLADRDAPVTLPELRASVERVYGRDLELTEPVQWISRFSDVTRQAERYRADRVLLAGDAAHVHFPIGGQGLNTGLQDAMNLGWKLAAQVHGWAPPGLLDTYHDERRPVAERVGLNTRAQMALMHPDQNHVNALREMFEELLRVEDANRHLTAMITGTDTRYEMAGDHPLVGRFAPDLDLKTDTGPTRVVELLQRGRGALIDLAARTDLARAAAPWADRIDVVAAQAAGEPPVEAMLVRPDGYVAWVAADGRPLTDALERWFGPARRDGES